ncbi:neuronal acetylcholine receptor subunit alpha-7-like [Uloborus diversus]|uniref:neuronal acetylcholine receptor subunit alpha-7-like n=1 Tax=Uloborus diversus TaxID=327109 RepID=UPI00240A9744|nr:neuronal acetylcholine receptor subunit alpha-7-like [Uloborus diversus]
MNIKWRQNLADLHFRIRTNIIMIFLGVLCGMFLVFGESLSATLKDEEFHASERDLRREIFENYDKLVRPVKSPSTSIQFSVNLTPLQVKEVDEYNQFIVLDSWMVMKWTDDYLKWDLADYNISVLRLPASEVWKPDLSLYSATPDTSLFPITQTQVLVYNNGDVLWVPPYTIKSRCPMSSLKKNHKGIIECCIKFGSWTYSENELDLQLQAKKVDVSNFLDIHPEWKLVHVLSERKNKKYPCCVEKYPSVEFNITMRRRSPYLIEKKIFE